MQRFYYYTDKEHDPTQELLKSWHETLEDYEKALGSNILPHINGEETSVGILAIAAYRVGWLPFLEFPVDRSPSAKSNQPKKGRGYREDLYLVRKQSLVSGTVKHDYWDIEAKYFQSDAATPNLCKKITLCLDGATKAVGSVEGLSKPATAMVFVVPTISPDEDRISDETMSELQDIKSFDADFCAIHLLPEDVWRGSSYASGCPAVAIIGRHFTKE